MALSRQELLKQMRSNTNTSARDDAGQNLINKWESRKKNSEDTKVVSSNVLPKVDTTPMGMIKSLNNMSNPKEETFDPTKISLQRPKFETPIMKQQEQAIENAKTNNYSKLESGSSGAVDALTLGLYNNSLYKKLDSKLSGGFNSKLINAVQEKSAQDNPISYGAGEVVGSIPAFAMGDVAAAKLIKGKSLLPRIARGALSGGSVGGVQSTLRGNDAKQIIGDAAIGALTGGLGEGAIYGIGKGLGKLNKPLSKVDDIARPSQEVISSTNVPKAEEKFILNKADNKKGLVDNIKTAYRNVFDDQSILGNISKETKIKASNARQSQGIVDFISESGLVDKEGRNIGQSLKDLTQELPLGKQEDFWRYMGHKQNVFRAAEGKNVFSQFDSTASANEAQKILSQNPEFDQAGKKVTSWINQFMDEWAVNSGLISKETIDQWKQLNPEYFPIYRDMNNLTQTFNNGKKGFVNLNNLVKKAKGAKSDLSSNIKNPIGNIAQLMNKTVRAAKNNEVGLQILNDVRRGGLDDIFEVLPTKQGLVDNINTVLQKDGIEGVMSQFADQFDDVFKQIEKGENIVKIMENGKEVLLKVKDPDYLKALKSLSDGTGKSPVEQIEGFMRKLTKPFKEVITGKNPFFAFFNAMKDTPTAFIQGQENNPIKFAARYMKALKEISSNSKGFQEFAAQGGMQSGFFKNDIFKTIENLKNPNTSYWEKFIGKIEAFNNLTEATPRYMEYMATLEKGGTKAEGIYNAAEVTVNFSRSGKWGKTIDSFIPYLNPALQGIDKFVRTVKNKPLQTLLKGATVITAPEIITNFINKDNPNFQSLEQRIKDDFFLIPNMLGARDKEGYAETFFRVPKARQYSVIMGVLLTRIGKLTEGKSISESFKGFGGAINRNFSVPVRTLKAPIDDIAKNKDWKGAPIRPLGMELDNRSNYLKYDETTSEIGKVLSKALSKVSIDGEYYSPKDIDYLIESYTGIIGDLILPAATQNKNVSDSITRKFIADSVYSNKETTEFYDNLNKLRTKSSDKNILDNIPSELVTPEEAKRNLFNIFGDNISKLSKVIKQSDDKEKQRFLRKQINSIAKKGNQLYNK